MKIEILESGQIEDGNSQIKVNSEGARILVSKKDHKDIKANIIAFCECGLIVCDMREGEEILDVTVEKAAEKLKEPKTPTPPKTLGGRKRF